MSASASFEREPLFVRPKILAGADRVIVAISDNVYSLFMSFKIVCFEISTES